MRRRYINALAISLGLFAAFTVHTAAVYAQPAQSVSNIEAAIALIEQEQAEAKKEGRPIKLGRLHVTWRYGDACNDAASLIPPPMDGWGPLNDVSLGEWPIGADHAVISYSTFDDTLDPTSVAYAESRQNVSIRISSGTAQAQGLEQFLSMEALRGAMFVDGPYGYPVQKSALSTLVGSYVVQVGGYGDAKNDYFKQIIACAIRGGLIAKGVDASSLADPDAISP